MYVGMQLYFVFIFRTNQIEISPIVAIVHYPSWSLLGGMLFCLLLGTSLAGSASIALQGAGLRDRYTQVGTFAKKWPSYYFLGTKQSHIKLLPHLPNHCLRHPSVGESENFICDIQFWISAMSFTSQLYGHPDNQHNLLYTLPWSEATDPSYVAGGSEDFYSA